MSISPSRLTYLQLLAEKYPNRAAATTEIINLEAIMELPKATEHFMSDLHGEFAAFNHVLRNGSGNIKEKISEVFGQTLSQSEKDTLATIIYYPEEKLTTILEEIKNDADVASFFTKLLNQLVSLAQFVVSKYTRSRVRKTMAADMAYIMDELIFKDSVVTNKSYYYDNIIQNVIELKAADRLAIRLSELIRELVVGHLHIVGDIFDRGPDPDKIISLLMQKPSIDIQWGNHDIIWMGAACGSRVLIANVIRICARYDNLDIIEQAYGISLRQLLTFVDQNYPDEGVWGFMPKVDKKVKHFSYELKQIAKMQQAMAIIQFKLEHEIIKRHPEYKCNDRLLLDKIDYGKGEVRIGERRYPLLNVTFPTINWEDPYKLTDEEEFIMARLEEAFRHCEKLHRHIAFLLRVGRMYTIYNNNLLFHGCLPLNADGSMMTVEMGGCQLSGRELFDEMDHRIRLMYQNRHLPSEQNPYLDDCWYLWQGPASMLFGKEKMATFERYYVADKATHDEPKNPYYYLREDEEVVNSILETFGLEKDYGHIINGHTPIREKKGEDPIKANGKLFVIDGGYSKAYQETTGLAGYTLLYNSFGIQLVSHQPFKGIEDALKNGTDIVSTRRVVDKELERKTVRQTDVGQKLTQQVECLKDLLAAFSSGIIEERELEKRDGYV